MLVDRLRITTPREFASPIPRPGDERSQVWHGLNGQVAAIGHVVDGRRWMHIPGLASYTFSEKAGPVVAVATAATCRASIRDAYHRSILPVIVQLRGYEVVHASAIVTRRGVVAFCGHSGAGKSTIAWGLKERGYQLWADDAVAFEVTKGAVLGIPLPFSPRLRSPSARHFGVPDRDAGFPRGCSRQPDRARRPRPLSRLFLLRQSTASSRYFRSRGLTPAETFRALLPHAYCFDLERAPDRRRMVEHYMDLSERVPATRIRYAPGLGGLSALLDEIERLVRDE